jgi:hypothetical protein
MSEIEKIILTSAFTILGGIVVLVIGQILLRFFIEPFFEHRKLIGEIADALIYYANVYGNPGTCSEEVGKEASQSLRQKASLLRARTYAVPWYNFFVLLRLAPHRKSIEEAASNLIGLSNSVYRGDSSVNDERQKKIREALSLPLD